MKLFIRSATLAVAVLLSTAAQASSFKFTYSFLNDITVTGTFEGTAHGNLVTDLTNISVFHNGDAFVGNGSLYAMRLYGLPGEAVVSFDGRASNFVFTSSPFIDDTSDSFSLAPIMISGDTDYAEVRSPSGYAFENSTDGRVQAHWQLQAVPEPETYAMLLTGLGLLGWAARRKRAS